MFIGIIAGIGIWYFSKSFFLTAFGFYLITGIHKSRLWLTIPVDIRHRYLPPLVQASSIGSFIKGVFLWPLVTGLFNDPIKNYFKDIDDNLIYKYKPAEKISISTPPKTNGNGSNNNTTLEKPKVKLKSRPNSSYLQKEFEEGLKEDDVEYRTDEFINDLKMIDFKYIEWGGMWENILMEAYRIDDIECYTFEISVFLFFEMNLLMVFENKTTPLLRKIVNKRMYAHIKSISPYITNKHIEKRLELYQAPFEWLRLDENIRERCASISYGLFFAFCARASQIGSLYDVIDINDDEHITYQKNVDTDDKAFNGVTDFFLQDINNILNTIMQRANK